MKRTAFVMFALLVATSLHASARLTYMIGGKSKPIEWNGASFPISYSVDRAAEARLPGLEKNVEDSFAAWQAIPGTALGFRDDGIRDTGAGHDGVNSVSLSDDLLANSGFVAYTTTWFDDSGTIREADIQLDASSVKAGNVRNVVQHEIGHLLGLDHSAVVSAVMYPYVDGSAPSDLDSDDRLAIQSLYPLNNLGTATASLSGKVSGDGGAIFGAQVVALDEKGSPVASTLTAPDGSFTIDELPPGRYRLYAEPLDGPVDPGNLSGVWRNSGRVTFGTGFLQSGSIDVHPGGVYSNLQIRGASAVSLNPKWIGTFPPNTTDVQLGTSANAVHPGEVVSIAVGGDGMGPGSTQFTIPNDAFTRVSDFQYGPNYVWATFRIAANAQPGSLVLLVSNNGEQAALTGALRIEKISGRSRASGR